MLSSLRNFFLALFISLLVFGVSAYFLVGFIDDNASGFGPQQNNNGEDVNGADNGDPDDDYYDDDPIDTSEFTALIIGIDSGLSQQDERQEADLIILLNVNAKTQTIMVSPLSCDMRTEVKGYVLRLGAVYSEFDAETFVETVWAYTGLMADYYCVLDYEGVEKIFNILGDVSYNIPMDMFYDPFEDIINTDAENTNEITGESFTEYTTEENEKHERIDLKAGLRRLNGEMAIQLLRYRNYSNGNSDRMATQLDFLKEVIRQKMTFQNLINAHVLYERIKESVVETNMDAISFEKYAETLFSLSQFTFREILYPGYPRNENGVLFYSPDVKTAVSIYRSFRKGMLDNINNQ